MVKMLAGQAGGRELGAPVPKPKGRHIGMHLCVAQLLKAGRWEPVKTSVSPARFKERSCLTA